MSIVGSVSPLFSLYVSRPMNDDLAPAWYRGSA